MSSTSIEQTVYVVDDDRSARESVCALVRSMGILAIAFASAEELLKSLRSDARGCIVSDVRMEGGMSGDELQARLNELGVLMPIILLTAFAKTSLTVKVMQAGAVTLLEKPYRDNELWDAIRKALTLDSNRYNQLAQRQEVQDRYDQLTPQELEVLRGIVAGKANKQIAKQLDVSLRTVESRRHVIFEKFQVKSVAELVRLVIEAGIQL
jgi:FixJ family two-component response regulator